MQKIWIKTFIVTVLFSAALQAQEQYFEFDSATAMEADFSLDAQVNVVQSRYPTRDQIDGLIRKQMRYMLGVMHARQKSAAALYPKWSFTIMTVKKNTAGVWEVKYNLKGKGEFKKGTTYYTFTLPYNPNSIFNDSAGKCMKETAQESNYWYHWDPLLAGCPLKEGVHFYNLGVQLAARPNTTLTYPEYSRLVDADKTVKITMFFGFENYDYPNWIPQGADWGIRAYNQHREFLKSRGFTERQWTQQEVEAIYKAKDGKVPYVLEMTYQGGVAKLRVRLVLSDTGFSHNSLAFHHFLKEALAKESVIVYDGHSGIGKNLDIPAIERLRGFKMPISMNYQILFLGSCLPYAYYPEIFFNKKRSVTDPKGTKNLDIFTYGEESLFGSKEDQLLMRALIRYAKDGGRVSYQTMIKLGPNYMFAINGDEDNPTK